MSCMIGGGDVPCWFDGLAGFLFAAWSLLLLYVGMWLGQKQVKK